jgi:hypothetical protein
MEGKLGNRAASFPGAKDSSVDHPKSQPIRYQTIHPIAANHAILATTPRSQDTSAKKKWNSFPCLFDTAACSAVLSDMDRPLGDA